jgi:DNA-directed RNA polymerase beta' subunit
VVEITSRDTYNNNKPVPGGLFDIRMGVLEPNMICPTDGYTYIDTPGYFGHIELARPVFAMQHMKDIMKIIRCVCFKCSKLLINKNNYKHVYNLSAEDRWEFVSKEAAGIQRCGNETEDGCGCRQPHKTTLDGICKIEAVWNIDSSTNLTTARDGGNTVKFVLTPEIVHKIFKRISDDDVFFMGFHPKWSRPEWMIYTVLPVPPPAVRPSVKYDAQQRSEDDLTHIYSNIIKCNTILKEKLADPNYKNTNTLEKFYLSLQYYVAAVVNNKIKGMEPMVQRSARPLQCITDRLNTKYGRIRGNLMGKRVDFSARSVITGDPNLSIRQLGVPLKISKNITKPVVVNRRTHDFLLQLVRNGPDEYPGAKILQRRNGEQISLRHVDRTRLTLQDGDVVHRHMMDGDAVLFNRQPSLHRMSMMCHIVKVMKRGDTFRMNVGCTKPYNADFDGDEMNMHMSQNVLAETELRHLAAIPHQLISPSGNAPIIGIYQDSLLGCYRFTRENITFGPREAMNLLMRYAHVDTDALRACGSKISSFSLLSQILPPLSMQYSTKLYNDKEEDYVTSNHVLEIRAGQYIRGQIEKSVLAQSTRGILHRVCNDFGNMSCANFIDDLQNVITEYMKSSSYSVGISDLIADQTTQTQIAQVITKQKSEVDELVERVHLGIFENTTARSNREQFEMMVNNILNKATDESGKIGRSSLSPNNRFKIIVDSGSKGTAINISHMISCVGQQNVEGKRIPYGFEGRTLPHFTKYDDGPSARGFVDNSYISGLTPPELFFLAMGGRIGLIDTAVKTSKTGYIQRRLIKGLEDLKVEYDMTVRNSKGKIIQFTYGDDGFDSTRVETQTLPLVGMSVEDIYLHYDIVGINDQDDQLLSVYTQSAVAKAKKQKPEAREKCKSYIAKMLQARDEIVRRVFKNKNESTLFAPVAFQHLIANIHGQLGLAGCAVDITPLEAFHMIEANLERMRSMEYAPVTPLFEILYSFYLTPKHLLVQKRFHRQALQLLLDTVALKMKEALVHPGELVGIIAGQSIGEPTTQLTLNSIIYEEEIVVRNSNKEVMRIPIGEFTERVILCSQNVDYMDDTDTMYASLAEYYEVPCATESGETVWRRIEAVTRHPVVNEDGTNTMLKVTTKSGRKVTATKAKSFLQVVDGKIQGVNGKDLMVGDYLPVSCKPLEFVERFEIPELDVQLDYNFGYKLGSDFANGKILSVLSEEDGRISEKIVFSNRQCIIGFLRAIAANPDFTPSSCLFKVDLQVMLKNLGTEEMQDFVPNVVDGVLLMESRNGRMPDLDFDQVVSIEEVPNTTPYAYDLTVEDTRNFDCYNGLCMRDTFHMAGVSSKSNVTLGVPRIEEILRLTSNPKNPSLTVFLKSQDEQEQAKATAYATMMEHTRLLEIVKSVDLCFDPNPQSTELDQDRAWMEQYHEFEHWFAECSGESSLQQQQQQQSKWVVRLAMDPEMMLEKNITMDDVHFAMCNSKYSNDIQCAYSDFNADQLIFRVRLNNNLFTKGKRREHNPGDAFDQSDDIYVLKNFQNQLLAHIVLRGVSGIERVVARKLQSTVVHEGDLVAKKDGKYVTKNTWVLDTTGTNLIDVLALDYIDGSRTFSNDIREIHHVLGIEAARQMIHNEMADVIEFSGGGYINYHHLGLLCDRMTCNHNMVPIFRSGLLNDDTGPIAKCTFEEQTAMLLQAARHGDVDHMRGVSANVMCGQFGNFGTGAFQLVLDMEQMQSLDSLAETTDDDDVETKSGNTLSLSKAKMTIHNNIGNLKTVAAGEFPVNDDYNMGF